MKHTIYMDLCCFNRPFDDQSSEIVHLETEAKLFIQNMIRNQTVNLVWSFMLMYENHANPNTMIMQSTQLWQKYASATIAPHERIFSAAQELMALIKSRQKTPYTAPALSMRSATIFSPWTKN